MTFVTLKRIHFYVPKYISTENRKQILRLLLASGKVMTLRQDTYDGQKFPGPVHVIQKKTTDFINLLLI
jgi:hypothetical protein